MRLRHWSRSILALAAGFVLGGTTLAGEYDIPVPPAEVVVDANPAPLLENNPSEVVDLGGQEEVFSLASDPASVIDCCNPCDICPRWTVRTGIVFLRRDNQDDLVLSNGATPITVGNLGFNEYTAGPAVTVIRHGFLNSAWDLDVTYFGVNDFHSTASSAGATTFFTTPNINFGGQTVTSDYRSRLNSTELNFRRNWNNWFTVLGGFRWVELQDVLATDIGGIATHSVNVNNHLYGFQFGGEALILTRGRFSVDAVGKAGIYGNQADQSTDITGVGGAVPALSARDTTTAFVGELGLTGAYAINDRWTVRGGYQAIWVDGVALAPDQFASSDILTGEATLDMSGHPIYHGFTLAAELGW